LSTHGILKDEGTSYVNELFRELLAAGLVAQEQRTGFNGSVYQLLTLTEQREEVMRGKAQPELSWPERGSGANSAGTREKGGHTKSRHGQKAAATEMEIGDLDTALFSALKKKRFELARERNLPAYTIFPDDTLKSFASLKPQNQEAARRIRGVGEVKAERYLGHFLAIIQAHAARENGDAADGQRVVLFDEI
ncbi:MAG: HRDC domain-containing protein, partial [Verrucomicrobia bacterium]|nr:HRDC domain-containing protein [Verrucomicrobiota bacterium]